MDFIATNHSPPTPVKDPHGFPSKSNYFSKTSENSNPNVSDSSPGKNLKISPQIKSVKSQKSAGKNPVVAQNPVIFYPRNKIRERKFFVAAKKKNKNNNDSKKDLAVDCKCKERFGGNVNKCLCVAYETLRASQEEFCRTRNGDQEREKLDADKMLDERSESEAEEEEIERCFMDQKLEIEDGDSDQIEQLGQAGDSTVKRRRDRVLEKARNSVPESGRVKHLVKAFEELMTIPNSKNSEKREVEEEFREEKKQATRWALPGLQPEIQVSSSSFCPSDLFLTSENLGLDPRFSVSSSWDSSQGSRTSNGSRRGRRNSTESCGTTGGRRWKKKQLKATCQKPFKLRTEQRGRLKEEEFMKKIHEMMVEEERQRIPIAQGLPWTTDEPECLIKPPVKEYTRPIDLKLHSDIRAVERAEFDNQVAEKMAQIEQYKMERERLQKMEEEEEIRRLRKELIPKAQPMPYFDRPFIPRRSTKHPTVPREPKFHIPQHKKIKCCLSWNDMSTYTFQQ